MNAILEEQEKGRSEKVLSQLGLKYSVNLNKNSSFLVFDHWKKGLRFDKRVFTKRNMLSAVATCWSPLNEVGPLLTSGNLAISNLWKLQKFLAEKLKSAKEDLCPRKNFNPLANQIDPPKEWTKFQSKSPRIGWDNNLEKLDLSMLDKCDS